MNVLIIEDEAPAARRLQKMLVELEPGIQVLGLPDSVESAVNWLKGNNVPELIFMDIQLSDGLSFEIFDHVDITSPVIFTTAYDEYALKAFKVNSIDYLLKPISTDELRQSLAKYHKLNNEKSDNTGEKIENLLNTLKLRKDNYKSRFLVKIGDKYFSISSSQAAYFYTEDKAVYLMTHDKARYPVDHSLDDLEKMLDPSCFFRINRQYIVHVDAVNRLHSYFNGKMKVFLKPEAPEEVIVSRDKASLLKDWLDR